MLSKQDKRREKSENSKGRMLNYTKLEIQNYLKSDKISVKEAKLLFKIRTNMLEVRINYKGNYLKNKQDQVSTAPSDFEHLQCPLCNKHLDNEENIFKCEELKNDSEAEFMNLFSKDMNKMSKALKQFHKLWKIRKNKLEN